MPLKYFASQTTTALAATILPPDAAAPTARGASGLIACTGPSVNEGRAVAKAADPPPGRAPETRVGRLQIHGGTSHHNVVSTPKPSTPKALL